jgi:hypothetical protein
MTKLTEDPRDATRSDELEDAEAPADTKRSMTSSSSSSSQSELPDLRYGCVGRPAWLQWLNNIVGAVAFLSLANCFQSLANGLLGVGLSTIEKRFDLSSSSSSWIASASEIGFIPVLIFLSYLGNRSANTYNRHRLYGHSLELQKINLC